MLKRLLRGKSDGPDEDARTYLERLLDAALPAGNGRPTGAGADPMVSFGALIVDAESTGGWSRGPSDPTARELFVRTYASLLLDNDRNPPAMQLTGRDIERPRALLASFFTGSPQMHAEAQAVLRVVEDRFAQGRFAQARLLLQLFDTDAGTRRNNERNLFYEECALRMLSARSTPLADAAVAEFSATAAAADGIGGVARAAARVGIRLHVFAEDSARADQWVGALGGTSAGAAASVRRLIPGPRWRPLGDREPAAAVLGQLGERGIRAYTAHVLRTIYFVALAPGRTGHEPLLLDGVSWMAREFHANATRLLPHLHRATTLEEHTIAQTLDALWDEHLAAGPMAARSFGEGEVRTALESVAARLAGLEPRSVPDGDYDLGGLAMGHLVGLSADLATELRLNRLA